VKAVKLREATRHEYVRRIAGVAPRSLNLGSRYRLLPSREAVPLFAETSGVFDKSILVAETIFSVFELKPFFCAKPLHCSTQGHAAPVFARSFQPLQ
jgi:hypothetical protein